MTRTDAFIKENIHVPAKALATLLKTTSYRVDQRKAVILAIYHIKLISK